MLALINGKKTYIVGVASLLYAILGLALGKVDSTVAMEMISTALLAMGVRHGMQTGE